MKWLVLLLISILCPSCYPTDTFGPDFHTVPSLPQSIKELRGSGYTRNFVHPGDFFYKDNETLIWNYVTKCRTECIEKSKSKYIDGYDNYRRITGPGEYDPERMKRFRKHRIYTRGCFNFCYDEISPKFAVATHIKDGLYSDGSFYKMGKKNFLYTGGYFPLYNKHPKKDQYQKTEWQKARDECMEATRQIKINRKGLGWETSLAHTERLLGLYNDCLKERGY